MRTVGDLIKELQGLDPDGEIFITDSDGDLTDFKVEEVEGVETPDDGVINVTMLKQI